MADTAGDWLIPTVTAPGQIWMLYRVSLAARAGEDRRRASGPVSSRLQAKCPPRAKPAAWARSGSHPAPPGLTTARHLPHGVPVAPVVPCSDASGFPVQRALPFHMTSAEVSGPRHVEQRARSRPLPTNGAPSSATGPPWKSCGCRRFLPSGLSIDCTRLIHFEAGRSYIALYSRSRQHTSIRKDDIGRIGAAVAIAIGAYLHG